MARLRRLRHIYGTLTPAVEQFLATSVDDTVDEILDAATALWRDDAWCRFDDEEANCTIQLYKWAEAAIRNTPALRLVSPRLEWVQPTPEMLAGLASAKRMSRPDIRLSIGTAAGITMECKRLRLSSSQPKHYVQDGMRRFVDGRYSPDEERGAMIGYVQQDEPAEIVDAVNDHICSEATMGPSHILGRRRSLTHIQDRYQSNHVRIGSPPIRLTHYLIDIR